MLPVLRLGFSKSLIAIILPLALLLLLGRVDLLPVRLRPRLRVSDVCGSKINSFIGQYGQVFKCVTN